MDSNSNLKMKEETAGRTEQAATAQLQAQAQTPATFFANTGSQQTSSQSASLMPGAGFTSRFEKDLVLGQAIKSQVEDGIPRGSLRAISSLWLNKYLEYVNALALSDSDSARSTLLRPSPIMNFDLLELYAEYQGKLQTALHFADPASWCEMFNSWEHMQLREDLKTGDDFYLLTQANWTKLKTVFGGGPEIPFFQYQKDVEVLKEDGTTEIKKESDHDFCPIRVRTHVMKRCGGGAAIELTLLVSKHLTHNQFKNYVSQVIPEVGSRVQMYVVRPASNLPIILEVSKEKKCLAELGVEDLTEVVIFDADVDLSSDKQLNTTQLFHNVAKKFGIERSEYQAFLPKCESGAGGKWADGDFGSNQTNQPGSSFAHQQQSQSSASRQQHSGVPPEYQHDPELYYAIQASLGETADIPPQAEHGDFDMQMEFEEEQPGIPKYLEEAHNVSLDGGEGTPKRRQQVGPIFDENEFAPGSTAPQVQESALAQQQQMQQQRPAVKQITRAEHAKLLRESKRAQFEQKRNLATQKMEQRTQQPGSKGSFRGQLSSQFPHFSEVQSQLSKLRNNFEAINSGKMQIEEVYDLADVVELSSGLMGNSMGKQKATSVCKMLKSAGSALGGDEIDSECRTEDDEQVLSDKKSE